MKRIILSLFAASMCAFVFCQGNTVCIRAGKVFDGEKFLSGKLIRIDGDTITGILDAREVPPEGASIVDASDMTVVPGFINSHIHFFALPSETTSHPEKNSGKAVEQYISLLPENRVNLFRNGVTAIVDMGCTLDSYLGMEKEISSGAIICPELYFPGPLFTAPGGHPAGTIYTGSHFLIDRGTVQTADPGMAARKVDELADAGVDFIKIVYDGRQGIPRLPFETAKAIIAAARRRSLKVFAHVTSPEEARDMIDAGADGLEHDFKDMPSLAGLMAEKHVFFTPTLQAFEVILPQYLPGLREVLKSAYDAGVPVAVGTDFPTSSSGRCGDDYMEELRQLERCGIPREEVLRSATAIGAEKIGKHGEIGYIREGYRANLVLFRGDLETGEMTADRIEKVMFHGDTVIEKGVIPPERKRFFESRSFMATPYMFYDSLNSLVVGLSLMDFDLLDSGVTADLTASCGIAGKGSASVGFNLPSPFPGVSFDVEADFDGFKRLYYGTGEGFPPSGAIPYDSSRFAENLHIRHRLSGGLSMEYSVSLNQNLIPADSVAGDPRIAVLDDPNETLFGLSLVHDARDNASNPWYGTYLALGGDVSMRPFGSSHDFGRISCDVRGYISPVHHYTLGVRFLYRQAFGDVPVFHLPSFGGAAVGRGFGTDRFRDNLLMAGQLELRFPVIWILKGVLFADAGQVLRDIASFDVGKTRLSYGFGLRAFPSADEKTVLSYDAGFSAEGWTFSFRYGHAF